jgi:hypothetical protein
MSAAIRKAGNPNFVIGNKIGERFKLGEPNPVSDGRIWLSEQERETFRRISPKAINNALDILAMPLTPETAGHKLQAIDLILKYAYGTPQIATLVRYEVGLICEAYNLPSYNQLQDKDGNKLFGRQGGFKPSQTYKSAWDRQEAIKRIRAKHQEEDAALQDADADKPPEVRIYEAKEPMPVEPKPTDPVTPKKVMTKAELMARWKALSE